MIKRTILLSALLALVAARGVAVEAGILGGTLSKPGTFCYGLSAGSGMLVPLLKVEFEGYRLQGEAGNFLTAGVKVRPSFGKVAPYAVLGAGTRFEKLTFHFSEYEFYTFFGGGLHLFPISILSLRFDLRLIHFEGGSRVRITGGVFVHL